MKNLPPVQEIRIRSQGREDPLEKEIRIRSQGREDPLEKEMANHSNILPWEIPWTEDSGGLQSMGSQKSPTR